MIADLLDSSLATGLVGVAGVFLGIFAERLVQRYGRLRFESDGWEAAYSAGSDDYGGSPGVEPRKVAKSRRTPPFRYGTPSRQSCSTRRSWTSASATSGLRSGGLTEDSRSIALTTPPPAVWWLAK